MVRRSTESISDTPVTCQHSAGFAFEDVLGQMVKADFALDIRILEVLPLRPTCMLTSDDLMIQETIYGSHKCFVPLASVGTWLDFILDHAVGDPVKPILLPQLTLAGFPFESAHVTELSSASRFESITFGLTFGFGREGC
jgi:hypothetical protein